MEDEREPAVELLEALGVGQRLLALRLGERASRLVTCGAQQVEVLPVQGAPILGGGEDDDADQPLMMDQRNDCPRAIFPENAIWNVDVLVCCLCPAFADRL